MSLATFVVIILRIFKGFVQKDLIADLEEVINGIE